METIFVALLLAASTLASPRFTNASADSAPRVGLTETVGDFGFVSTAADIIKSTKHNIGITTTEKFINFKRKIILEMYFHDDIDLSRFNNDTVVKLQVGFINISRTLKEFKDQLSFDSKKGSAKFVNDYNFHDFDNDKLKIVDTMELSWDKKSITCKFTNNYYVQSARLFGDLFFDVPFDYNFIQTDTEGQGNSKAFFQFGDTFTEINFSFQYRVKVKIYGDFDEFKRSGAQLGGSPKIKIVPGK